MNKVLLGALVGVTVGTLAGILFAPAKGSKTRKRIVNKVDNYKNDFKSKIEDFANSISEQYDTILDDIQDVSANHKN